MLMNLFPTMADATLARLRPAGSRAPLARRSPLITACAVGLLQTGLSADVAHAQSLPPTVPTASEPLQAPAAHSTKLEEAIPPPSAESAEIESDAVVFDAGMLEQRGIDPALAQVLSQAPRFTAGVHQVSLEVNAQPRGQHAVRFDTHGQPCVDPALLDAAGLLVPAVAMPTEGCLPFEDAYSLAHVSSEVETLTLGLVVPADALRELERGPLGFATGGTAALVNYDLTQTNYRSDGRSSRYRALSTEMGFNAGEWIVRSRQVHTDQDGGTNTAHLETYAQRSIAQHRAVLQVGQINLFNPLLPGVQMSGVQVGTEEALTARGTGATVAGIANGQARIEVRQQGTLIYTTVVPAGPFELRDVQPLNAQADLEVTVLETDGSPRTFTVPAALFGVAAPSPGFTVGVGRARNLGGAPEQPWVASAGWSGSLPGWANLSSGLMLATDYGAVGVGVTVPVAALRAQAHGQIALSRDTEAGEHGTQALLSWSQVVAGAWSLNLAASHQTTGYRELLDVTLSASEAELRTRYRDQYSANLGWSSPLWGALSIGFSQSTQFNGKRSEHGTASWARTWRRLSLAANAERNLSPGQPRDTTLYLNASMPLGGTRRLRARVRDDGHRQRFGVGVDEIVSPALSYRVNAERRSDDGQTDWSAGVSWLPRYVQTDFNYVRNGGGAVSTSAALRGGLVWHQDGLTASPYPVGETFAVLAVGKDAGVQITTPSGPVWTDASGRAVIPRLSPYTRNPLEVVTKTLPPNAELHTGSAVLEVGRGAVEHVSFAVTATRRVLLTATDDSGQVLPAGTAVTDDHSQFVGLAQADGQVFLSDHVPGRSLWAQRPGQPRCKLTYTLPDKPDPRAHYETAAATCRSHEE